MRESVTFIHAADLHLGAPFSGLSTDNAFVGGELAEATYRVFGAVVDEAIARAVDFVALAGDLYDAKDPSLRSQLALRREAQRLAEAGIPLLIVRGNHDPLGGWSAGLAMPENVVVFGSRDVGREVVVDEDGFVCAVYGRSYERSAETSDFSPGYVRDPADTVAVGLLHANVGNNPDYDPYAPCTLSDLTVRGMDYWALGHIHKHEVLSTDPHVVYAGSPQGLNPKETGDHGCCVVTLGRRGVASFEHLDLAAVSWAAVDVDVDGVSDLDEVERRARESLEGVREAAGRPGVVRMRLVGRAPVHAQLMRPGVREDLRRELQRDYAAASPWVWLDRFDCATAPDLDVDAWLDSPEFAGEVARAAARLEADPEALAALVGEIVSPLAQKAGAVEPGIPALEALRAARDRALGELVADADGGVR